MFSWGKDLTRVYDRQSNCRFELALARHSWRVRASKLFKGSQKPSINQVQWIMKEYPQKVIMFSI
ncbi:hypothetical protein Hdeb2414_s0014g00422101 [Helianthus debilis subsp. tardiflorus]